MNVYLVSIPVKCPPLLLLRVSKCGRREMDPLRLLSFDGHVVTRRRVLQLARLLACLIKEEIPPRNLKLLLDPAERRIFFSFSFSLPIPIPPPPPRMRGRVVGVAAM